MCNLPEHAGIWDVFSTKAVFTGINNVFHPVPLGLHDSKTLFHLLGVLLLSAANFCLLNGNCMIWVL